MVFPLDTPQVSPISHSAPRARLEDYFQMPSRLDVIGTIGAKSALIILMVIAAGLVLAFTPIRIVGYVLLAAAAVLYIIASVRTVSFKR